MIEWDGDENLTLGRGEKAVLADDVACIGASYEGGKFTRPPEDPALKAKAKARKSIKADLMALNPEDYDEPIKTILKVMQR